MQSTTAGLFNSQNKINTSANQEIKKIPPKPTAAMPEDDNRGSSWSDCFKRLWGSKRSEPVILLDSNDDEKTHPTIDTASTVMASPVASPELRSFQSEVKSPTHIELTEVMKISNKEEETIWPVASDDKKDVAKKRSKYPKMIIGVLVAGGMIFSLYEFFSEITTDRDTSRLTWIQFFGGGCFGVFSSMVGLSLKKFELFSAGTIILQGMLVDSLGWHTPDGDLAQAVSSPLFVSMVLSHTLSNAVIKCWDNRNSGNHTRASSQTVLGPQDPPEAKTFKQLLKAKKISLAASAALIGSGSYGWSQSGNSLTFNTLSQACIHLGTFIPSKLLAHHFLDSYFLRFRIPIGLFASSVSSIFLSETFSTVIGPIGTTFFMIGLGVVLAADQTHKTYQMNKRIKLMEKVNGYIRNDSSFINALKKIVKCKDLKFNFDKAPDIMFCNINLSKIGFTKNSIRAFSGLLVFVGASPFFSYPTIDFTNLLKFSFAYTFLLSSYTVTNCNRLNIYKGDQVQRSIPKKILQKIILSPYVNYIARTSLFPLTISWGYYVNFVWTRAYRIYANKTNPWVTVGDYIVFCSTAGAHEGRTNIPTEWENLSENTKKTLIRFFENGNDTYSFTATRNEIMYMLNNIAGVHEEVETKLDSPHHVHRVDVIPTNTPKSRVLITKQDNKKFCDIFSKVGFFKKNVRIEIVDNHDPDTAESKKLIYTAMWPDVVRLGFKI